MKLRILDKELPEEPVVFVSLNAEDESGVEIILHVNEMKIGVAWLSKRGRIVASSLTTRQRNLLMSVGFSLCGNAVLIEQ